MENSLYDSLIDDIGSKDSGNVKGVICSISGPVVEGKDMAGCMMYEIVKVGKDRLTGEVIKIQNDRITIQVFEDTIGLSLGDIIERTYKPLTVELGPGLFENIYDGIQRPLSEIRKKCKNIYIPKGIEVPSLNREKMYLFTPLVKIGDKIEKGGVVGTVEENSLMKTVKIVLPPTVGGKVMEIINKGSYNIETEIGLIKDDDLNKGIKVKMYHSWPVRKPRPIKKKLEVCNQLLTGQRILDSFFPIAQGGTAAIPGAFGCGKTVISQAVSKFSNSDVVIYVGCGERGNEMSEVLLEFPKLKLPKNGESIMKRTILIANTSNMPVAAREASIYTGITIAEYYRDQGLNVSLLADSTSRWAEALREISGRLGEMPADSGYPAYLSARLAFFYERAGRSLNLNNTEGSISIIGAVSPPGGDFSDPVTSATLSIVQVFWGLDKKLAQRKHFPSINVNRSYSKYITKLNYEDEYKNNIGRMKEILGQSSKIEEIIQLVGRNNLSEVEKMVLDLSSIIREDYLQQNGYSKFDKYCPFIKTSLMAKCIVKYYERSKSRLANDKITWDTLKLSTKQSFYELSRMKFILPNESLLQPFTVIENLIEADFNKI